MLPTPDRIRATRRAALVDAVLAALVASVLGLLLRGAWRWAGVVVALPLAVVVFRRGTVAIRRRRAVLARPFPDAWEAVLRARVAAYARLDDAARARFRQLVAIVLAETPITGVGCAIDDEVRVLVAASAVIPILGFPAWEYAGLRGVVVRPEPFDASFGDPHTAALRASGLAGTAGLFRGLIILSRHDLLAGFAQDDKSNVGIHEFAHLVDAADGAVDGVPAGVPRDLVRPWTALVHRELARSGSPGSGLPAYGYTDEAEFFAVASEYFFEAPEEMARRDPELHALLERIYRQRPLPAR